MMIKKVCKNKWITPALIFFTLISVTSLVTLAWISAQTQYIENKFKLATIDTELIEEVDDKQAMSYKNNVRIKNIGEATVYVRINMVLEIIDEENNIIANQIFYDKSGNKLDLNLNIEDLMNIDELNTSDWFFKDGYYYYKKSIVQNEETSILFKNMTLKKQIYLYNPTIAGISNSSKISLSILTEAIQMNAIDDVWDVEVDESGNLTEDGGSR